MVHKIRIYQENPNFYTEIRLGPLYVCMHVYMSVRELLKDYWVN